MKVVLDANVIIAAFAARGLCQTVFELCLGNHEIILSDDLLAEITKNLHRKIGAPRSTIENVAHFLKRHAVFADALPLDARVCRDPHDVHVLGLAVSADAECIVTGDDDLLVMKEFHHIPILSPRGFWSQIQKEKKLR